MNLELLLRDNKTSITSLVCAACFMLGLPCLSECGQYVLDLMDTYGAGMSVIIIAIFELIAIMWVYGVREYCRDIKAMLGFSPSWYFKVTTFFGSERSSRSDNVSSSVQSQFVRLSIFILAKSRFGSELYAI